MATTSNRKCKKVMTLRLNDKETSLLEQYCSEHELTYSEAIRAGIKLLNTAEKTP